MKYSDFLMDSLVDLGYTHCFFVNGGNIMHLVESASHRFRTIPVVHEVSAGIAVEYYNELSLTGEKAFALVTAGPGLTNLVTAITGAFLESREMLVIGGQVKSQDLKQPELRQNGIQEVDGVALVASITKKSVRLDQPMGSKALNELVRISSSGRKGPVFLEVCLDVQAIEGDFL